MAEPRVFVRDPRDDLVRCHQQPSDTDPVSREVLRTVSPLVLLAVGVVLLLSVREQQPTEVAFLLGVCSYFAFDKLAWLATLLWGTWRLRRSDELCECTDDGTADDAATPLPVDADADWGQWR